MEGGNVDKIFFLKGNIHKEKNVAPKSIVLLETEVGHKLG